MSHKNFLFNEYIEINSRYTKFVCFSMHIRGFFRGEKKILTYDYPKKYRCRDTSTLFEK